MPLRPLGQPARHLGAVPSTMTAAAAWARAGAPHGALVTAAHQTAGRGRHGRTWTDRPGESLLLSLVLRPALAPDRIGLVALAAGLAVAETADAFGAPARLKWPNDVLAHGPDGPGKLAGVLADVSWVGPRPIVVLGVGLNVRQRDFPDAIGRPAVSLRTATGRAPDRLAPLPTLLDRLAARLAEAERHPDQLLDAVTRRLVGLGEPMTVAFPGTDRPALQGTALGLAPDGALRLDVRGAVRDVHAGEVTLQPAPVAP